MRGLRRCYTVQQGTSFGNALRVRAPRAINAGGSYPRVEIQCEGYVGAIPSSRAPLHATRPVSGSLAILCGGCVGAQHGADAPLLRSAAKPAQRYMSAPILWVATMPPATLLVFFTPRLRRMSCDSNDRKPVLHTSTTVRSVGISSLRASSSSSGMDFQWSGYFSVKGMALGARRRRRSNY